MGPAWPLWALPFWTMGVPLIWAVIEKIRTPKHNLPESSSSTTGRIGATAMRPV